MSKVFNMVGGGGGGGKNISSIVITGLSSTDTVTCTKDGKSYTATWDETAQYWKIVGLPLGTFTLTATNGTKTKTETVLIDIAGLYEIEMALKLWLYRYGDECKDITGGYDTVVQSQASLTKGDDALVLSISNHGASAIIAKTINKISILGFTTINFRYTAKSWGTYGNFTEYGFAVDPNGNFSSATKFSDESVHVDYGEGTFYDVNTVETFNVSSLGSGIVAARIKSGGSDLENQFNITLTISEIWLE